MSVKPPSLMVSLLYVVGCSANAQTFDPRDPRSPLQLVRTIDLPNVKGRIDHLALDAEHQHLFVAENAAGSVDDIDLASGKVVGRITGLNEPQGVAWLAKQQEVAVASGDGLVTFYRTLDRHKVAVVRLGQDVDNVRVDGRNGNLVVGYGLGALAVIDPATHRVIRQVPLPAHPEAFELLASRVFVNVPDAHKIVIGDIDQGRVASTLSTGFLFGNFPMAGDASSRRIAVAYRKPGTVSVLDATSGKTVLSARICGDADDLYFRSGQLIVVCGSGAVELVDATDRHDRVEISTQRGARTGLLDREGNRLFIAVPSRDGPAAIWELAFRSPS